MNDCQALKHTIQDLLDQKKVSLDGHASNYDHLAFKNPLPNYEKGGPSNQNKSGANNTNYTNISFDYVVNNISESDSHVNVITINKTPDCNVTTRSGKVALKGAPSKPSSPSNHYNILDQLHKTPAHISILELMCLSPSHRAILDQALSKATVPMNLAEE